MADLLNLFDDLERQTTPDREKIIRAPFGYPGGKSRSAKHILALLPRYKTYVEPFGGSGVVLLNRPTCDLEVFNDRYAGVVAFYRCVQDDTKYKLLAEKCDLSIMSREEFLLCRDTWQRPHLDDVERAYRWIYMSQYSFASLCRNFGRATSGKSNAGKLREKAAILPWLHERLARVQIENLDFETCILDYDSHDTVFYLDPPYLEVNTGIYSNREFPYQDHIRMLDAVFRCKGFVAVSSYRNQLYDSYKWDDVQEWDSFVSMKSLSYAGNKAQLKDLESRDHAREVLYIKERSDG